MNDSVDIPLEQLIEDTIEKMALWKPGARPEGKYQEIDRLVIDCVEIRAGFEAINQVFNDNQKNSILFQHYIIGVTYSVGLKLRKLIDKDNGVVSLKNIWEQWYKHPEGIKLLERLASAEEAKHIFEALTTPKNTRYKHAHEYLQIVLAHNPSKRQKSGMWADLDQLLCLMVRCWNLLVRATDDSRPGFSSWEKASGDLLPLLQGKSADTAREKWREFISNANYWADNPCY